MGGGIKWNAKYVVQTRAADGVGSIYLMQPDNIYLQALTVFCMYLCIFRQKHAGLRQNIFY